MINCDFIISFISLLPDLVNSNDTVIIFSTNLMVKGMKYVQYIAESSKIFNISLIFAENKA